MTTTLRFHEIAEAGHRILNPMSAEKLDLLGEIASLGPTTRMLDLACGKAEMLCQWARRWGASGVGVDISEVFLDAARERAGELGVQDRVRLVRHDAATFAPEEGERFDIVACIGATWIGNGLVGTLALLQPHLAHDGLVLVGEPYWRETPAAGEDLMAADPTEFATLVGTMDRCESAGFELVEMVLSDHDDWDRYQATQWLTVADWLRAHPDDDIAPMVRATNAQWRRAYLDHGRRRWGWGVFVLRPTADGSAQSSVS